MIDASAYFLDQEWFGVVRPTHSLPLDWLLTLRVGVSLATHSLPLDWLLTLRVGVSLATHSLPLDRLLTLSVGVSLATSRNAMLAVGWWIQPFLND
jgi:hypothetical protein